MKCLLLILFTLITSYLKAQWSPDPSVNNPISIATGNQYYAQITSDDKGGAIIVWEDQRSGTSDIYAQRINSEGTVQWTLDGVAVCNAANTQFNAQLIKDGSGGAIITWEDWRNGNNQDIYAQKIDSNGTVLWNINGVGVCVASAVQWYPQLTTDGNGGAIITWEDYRNGNGDIYAQRIEANGTALWTTNGVVICNAAFEQWPPQITNDENGGAIITWEDRRNGTFFGDIYIQKVNSIGVIQWAVNGIGVCTTNDVQNNPMLVKDGSGGVIINWLDSRLGQYNIFTQKINGDGIALWTQDGVAVCTAAFGQAFQEMISDESGGAIIVWQDLRAITNNDVYVQRINSNGLVQWTIDGVAICTLTSDQRNAHLTSNGNGGAVIAWMDFRNGNYDVYAQKINSTGDIAWLPDGNVVCNSIGDQNISIDLINDESDGAIIVWSDFRFGIDFDIYASNIGSDGNLIPVELISFNATANNNEVELNWQTATETNNYGTEIERSQKSKVKSQNEWEKIGFVPGFGTTTEHKNYSYTDQLVNGGAYYYRLKQLDFDGSFEYSKVIEVKILTPSKFELSQNYPNPFNPSTKITYSIPSSEFVTLKLFDLLGNEVAVLVNEEKPAGNYEVNFEIPGLSSGIYFYSLRAEKYTQTKKLILMK